MQGKELTASVNPGSEMTLHLLNPTELTIQVLDVFDITVGQLGLIIGDKVVCWVHDSPGIGRVGQAKGMAKFMDGYRK